MGKEKGKNSKGDKCWEYLTDGEGPLWLEYSKQGVNGRQGRKRGREEANERSPVMTKTVAFILNTTGRH